MGYWEWHEGALRILLQTNEVHPENVDKWSETLFSWATGSGCEGVVRMQLEPTSPIPRQAENRQSTELLSTEPPELPFQNTRRF